MSFGDNRTVPLSPALHKGAMMVCAGSWAVGGLNHPPPFLIDFVKTRNCHFVSLGDNRTVPLSPYGIISIGNGGRAVCRGVRGDGLYPIGTRIIGIGGGRGGTPPFAVSSGQGTVTLCHLETTEPSPCLLIRELNRDSP